MKIIKKDTKHSILVIKPEVLDDLWVLEKIIEKGDIISGKTFRSITMQRDGVNVKTGQRPVFLKIIAETMEYNEQELRVKGKIIEGPEEVSHGYHTFEIKPESIVTIEKPGSWHGWQLKRLEKASIKSVKILVCIVDEKEADFASVSNKIDVLTTIRGPSGKSFDGYEERKKQYYNEIITFIKDKFDAGYEKMILAGPGFAKENLMNIIKDTTDFADKIITDSVSHTGIAGMRELMNRGTLDQISSENELSKQTQLVDEFFTQIAKEGLVTYGLSASRLAITNGNAHMLLISDTKVRDNEELIDLAEKMRTTVHIIDTHHDSGKRFDLFGGIAVFLRYKL